MGFGEILMIALVALIVLGPERLPEAARTIGKGISEARKAVEPARTMWRDISNDLNSVAGTTTGAFSSAARGANGNREKIHPVLEMMTPEERLNFTSGGEIPQRIADRLAAQGPVQADGPALTESGTAGEGAAPAGVELPHLDYAMPHADTRRQSIAAAEELYYPAPGNSDEEQSV